MVSCLNAGVQELCSQLFQLSLLHPLAVNELQELAARRKTRLKAVVLATVLLAHEHREFGDVSELTLVF